MSACTEPECHLSFGHEMPHHAKRLVQDAEGVWMQHRMWGDWRDYLGMPESEVTVTDHHYVSVDVLTGERTEGSFTNA